MATNANAGGAAPPPQLTVPRPDEATPADEMTMARGWLTHLRESAIYKLVDLDYQQLRWKTAPTANSLGGIVVHLGYAEREEVARHVGHMDITRELLDGRTGR